MYLAKFINSTEFEIISEAYSFIMEEWANLTSDLYEMAKSSDGKIGYSNRRILFEFENELLALRDMQLGALFTSTNITESDLIDYYSFCIDYRKMLN